MSPQRLRILFFTLLAAFSLSLVSCKDGDSSSKKQKTTPSKAEKISLNGAGATFPFPLYSKWMSEYNKLNPNIRINYQSIGSGGGIRQVTAGTVDFGATDAPMKPEVAKKAPGQLHHIPTTIGAVTVAYNLPGDPRLKLDGEAIAKIFLGEITNWSDPAIQATNEGVELPDQDITVVYRSDGSGTTAVFTDYLAKAYPKWKEEVGVGKAVRWPKGLGAKGNEGVTGQIKVTPGSIGYIELAYALQNDLSIAAVKNRAGNFVEPEVSAITAAAKGVKLPESLHASLTNAKGEKAYPISSFTYLLVYQDAKDETKGRALARFIWWALHDGQKFSADLHYAPLPEKVVSKAEKRLKGLTFEGKPLLDDA